VSYCGTDRANSQPFGIGKRKKTERTKGREGYGKTEFGQDAAMSVEEAIFVQSYKSRTGDLNLDHNTLDARSSGYHRVQVWSQSSHLFRSKDCQFIGKYFYSLI